MISIHKTLVLEQDINFYILYYMYLYTSTVVMYSMVSESIVKYQCRQFILVLDCSITLKLDKSEPQTMYGAYSVNQLLLYLEMGVSKFHEVCESLIPRIISCLKIVLQCFIQLFKIINIKVNHTFTNQYMTREP